MAADLRHDVAAADAAVAPRPAAAGGQHVADLRRTATRSASQAAVTWLSRPEKPPIATTSAPDSMIVVEAPPFWLETASVPPPWALM